MLTMETRAAADAVARPLSRFWRRVIVLALIAVLANGLMAVVLAPPALGNAVQAVQAVQTAARALPR